MNQSFQTFSLKAIFKTNNMKIFWAPVNFDLLIFVSFLYFFHFPSFLKCFVTCIRAACGFHDFCVPSPTLPGADFRFGIATGSRLWSRLLVPIPLSSDTLTVSPCPSLVARAPVCHIPVPGVAFAADSAHSGLWEAPGGDKHKSQVFRGLRRPG